MPHSTSAPRLGDLERVVMEHLWEASTTGGASFAGATVREAQRALTAAGLDVLGVATVAATVRRRPPGRSHSELSGARLSPGARVD